MTVGTFVLLLLLGAIICTVLWWLPAFMSPEARADRARRRSNRRITTKHHKQPMVKLSVKTKKDRE